MGYDDREHCVPLCRLIAGTYTPLCMLALDRNTAFTLLCIEWGAALLGMVRFLAL